MRYASFYVRVVICPVEASCHFHEQLRTFVGLSLSGVIDERWFYNGITKQQQCNAVKSEADRNNNLKLKLLPYRKHCVTNTEAVG